MKQNIKNQLLILLLLIAMMFVVFTGVLVISLSPNMIVNIIVIIAMILLTFFIFVLMKYLNKKLIYIEKEVKEEKNVTTNTKTKILCPKCHNPYDGEFCFVCGYERKNNG
jgi:uncharacterized membrane protein